MLSRKYKLSRTSFPRHTDQKSLWNGKFLRIQVYRSNREDLPRFAVVVAKRSSDSAVMRNTFKRSVFDALRREFSRFAQLPYTKYVFTPRTHLRLIALEHIDEDVRQFLLQNEPGAR